MFRILKGPLKTIFRHCHNAKCIQPKYDVVIVGGGMVGFSLAVLTASSKFFRKKSILLLEGASRKKFHPVETYHNRVVALNDFAVNMLKSVGAWDFISSHRAQPVKTMKVWESQSDACLVFGRVPLAHIVENNLVVASLSNLLDSLSSEINIDVVYDAEVRDILIHPSNQFEKLAKLSIRTHGLKIQNETIETNLVVGADGHCSVVRQAAGLNAISWDHGQKAIVATLRMGEGNEEFTAWQRFLPTGPIALLPLSKQYSSLVWSTTACEANRLLQLNETEFVYELNHYLSHPSQPNPWPLVAVCKLIGSLMNAINQYCSTSHEKHQHVSLTRPVAPHIDGLQEGSQRACFPLGFQHAHSYAAPRVALVGDAAHRILPLAGQGVNLGFGDAVTLTKHLETAISHGADIGSYQYLQKYACERQKVIAPIAATMELINLLYSTDAYAGQKSWALNYIGGLPLCQTAERFLIALRSAGMNTVQSSSIIKNFLIETAVTGEIRIPTSIC